jgi:mannose-1-phosphate guanylyltransferase/mannose-6-phosphate isomerase
MKIIILAGGSGTRLFPLSRINYPKQFLNIDSDRSLLSQTIERFLKVVKSDDIVIVTNDKYYFYVEDELDKMGLEDVSIIKEPHPRNTAPAITLAVKFLIEKLFCGKDEVFFVAPADHIIKGMDKFIEALRKAVKSASYDYISTLGIVPKSPETGYGYIKIGEKNEKVGYNVLEFTEKPDEERAKLFLEEGNYYWNSGMYAFSIGLFLKELENLEPDLYNMFVKNTFDEFISNFKDAKNISIDYAITEKSKRVVSIPIDMYWNDVGSWDAIFDMLEKDENGNVSLGDCAHIRCKDTFMMSNNRMVAAVGIENLVVVETDDIIMVAKKGDTQKVKEIVDKIKKRKEMNDHTTIYRPWGTYKIISDGEKYKVKKVTVKPGKSLMKHYHEYRSEHWIVTNGVATVIIENDDAREIRKNEGIYVPKGTRHKLINNGNTTLEIIEVQNGEYLNEEDNVSVEKISKSLI